MNPISVPWLKLVEYISDRFRYNDHAQKLKFKYDESTTNLKDDLVNYVIWFSIQVSIAYESYLHIYDMDQ